MHLRPPDQVSVAAEQVSETPVKGIDDVGNIQVRRFFQEMAVRFPGTAIPRHDRPISPVRQPEHQVRLAGVGGHSAAEDQDPVRSPVFRGDEFGHDVPGESGTEGVHGFGVSFHAGILPPTSPELKGKGVLIIFPQPVNFILVGAKGFVPVIAGSSKGRTAVSGTAYLGSIPSPAAKNASLMRCVFCYGLGMGVYYGAGIPTVSLRSEFSRLGRDTSRAEASELSARARSRPHIALFLTPNPLPSPRRP